MAESVRIEGLDDARRDFERLGDDLDDLDEIPAQITRVSAGRGRVYASRLGEVAEFGYPTRNVRPSRFMHAAIPATEARAPELIEDAIQHAIRKRGLA